MTVTAVQDNNADDETVNVSHTVASGDDVYDAVTAAGVRVEVTDDGFPVVSVSFGADAYTVSEDGMTASVTVSLSAVPYRRVVVPVTATNQGDASAGDYLATPTTLTFAADDTEQSFTFTAVDDRVDDDGESVLLSFGDLPDRVDAGIPATATVTIVDDDTAGVTIAPDTGLPVGEGDTGTYTVVLASQPTASVTVTPTSGDAAAVTVPPTVLTFTTGNWATAQTVTVTAVEDDNADDETVDVSHTAASTDSAYNLTGISVRVRVTDDEDAAVTVTGLSVDIDEGNTGTYTVVLASEPSATVTVTAASRDVGAVTVSVTVLTFTTGNWSTAQTVTVTAVEDDQRGR